MQHPPNIFYLKNKKLCLQVVACLLRVSRGRGYFSKHMIDKAVLQFYDKKKLWPDGLTSKLPACKEWSARMGLAISRLDFRLLNVLFFLFNPGLIFGHLTVLFCLACTELIAVRLPVFDHLLYAPTPARMQLCSGFVMRSMAGLLLGLLFRCANILDFNSF